MESRRDGEKRVSEKMFNKHFMSHTGSITAE